MQTVRKPFQIFLLCFVVLSIYYVTVFADFSLLDDREIILALEEINDFDLKSIFYPNSVKGGYYRPLIGIFYMLDRFVWGLDSKIMHLENVLFHLINVVLFFLIATELLINKTRKSTYIPLLTALLFAVHPIATESTNWISGRTDLLAGIFLLSATHILVKFRDQRPWWLWPCIGLCVLFGMFAKETAVAYVFVAFLLFRMKETPCVENDKKYPDLRLRSRGIVLLTTGFYATAVITALFSYNYYLVLLIITGYGAALYCWDIGIPRYDYLSLWRGIGISLIVAAALFFVVRKCMFVSDVAQIPHTFTLIKADLMYAFKVCTGAVGFYVKKFLFPFPLNLAIREIDPLYELLGIFILLLAVLCVRLGGLLSSLTLAGLFLVAPSLPLSLGTLAWTAYAERYIYLAIPFWLLVIVLAWNHVDNKQVWLRRSGTIIALLTLLLWSKGTFERNKQWQTNEALFKDTVQKSPSFKVTRGLYMLALYENERYDEALEQYWISTTLQSLVYDEKFDILYASILMKRNKPEEARIILEKVLQKKETVGVLTNLVRIISSLRGHYTMSDPRREEMNILISGYYERLYLKSGDAIHLYRLGQDYLSYNNRAEAKKSFYRAASSLPESSEYKKYARNLADKI